MQHPEHLRQFADWLHVRASDDSFSIRDRHLMSHMAVWLDEAIGDGERSTAEIAHRLVTAEVDAASIGEK